MLFDKLGLLEKVESYQRGSVVTIFGTETAEPTPLSTIVKLECKTITPFMFELAPPSPPPQVNLLTVAPAISLGEV